MDEAQPQARIARESLTREEIKAREAELGRIGHAWGAGAVLAELALDDQADLLRQARELAEAVLAIPTCSACGCPAPGPEVQPLARALLAALGGQP
jgi:hypothetical protein